MLWSARGQKQAQDSLRRELSNLRKQLRVAGAEHILIPELRRVTLALQHVEVDMLELARGRMPTRGPVTGEFMEGIDLPDADEFEDWLREQRDRARDLSGALQDRIAEADAALEQAGLEQVAPPSVFSGFRPNPKPALAVLPFATIPAKGSDSVGLIFSELVALCLSEFPQLLVVSSNAAAEACLQQPTRQAIAAALGVQYLVEGTAFLGAADGQCRVFSKIIDGASGEQVWSAQFEGQQDNALTFERKIAETIAPQIWTGIDLSERRRVLQMQVPARSSYDRYWQANALYRSWRPDDLKESARIAGELVGDEPKCPWANSLAAFCHAAASLFVPLHDQQAARAMARGYFETALRAGPDNLETLGYCAGTLLIMGEDLDHADQIINRALAILPGHQPALLWGGWVDVARGNARRALERFDLAMRINPTSNARGEVACGMALAHVVHGDWQTASDYHARALRDAPGFPMVSLVAPLIAAARRDPDHMAQQPDMLASALRMLPRMLATQQAS